MAIKYKKLSFLIIILTATFFLSACQSSSENSNSVSTTAEKIIQTIGNCPNEDYYSTSDITTIGEGADSSSENSEETEPVDTYQNLKDTLGESFTDTAFEAFYSQGIADKYFSDAFMYNYEISVQDIELVEKKDNSETVKVTFKKGSAEDTDTFSFTYDDVGLVSKIVITD